MIRPLLKAQVASVVLGVAAPFMHGWEELIAWHGGELLSWMSIAGFGVVLAWNVLHPDTEAREEREALLAEAREHRRAITERAAVAAVTGWERAVTDAKRAGTFSLNGVRQPGTTLRYVGPPALYTPPTGFEMMITVELKADARVQPQRGTVILHRETRWVFPEPRPECRLRDAGPCQAWSPCLCREHGYL
jgi:hypothetical protein